MSNNLEILLSRLEKEGGALFDSPLEFWDLRSEESDRAIRLLNSNGDDAIFLSRQGVEEGMFTPHGSFACIDEDGDQITIDFGQDILTRLQESDQAVAKAAGDEIRKLRRLLRSATVRADVAMQHHRQPGRITAARFLAMLASANMVTLDGSILLQSWKIVADNGKPSDPIVLFEWEDENGEYAVLIDVAGAAKGSFNADGTFLCENTEGDLVAIRCLEARQLLMPHDGIVELGDKISYWGGENVATLDY